MWSLGCKSGAGKTSNTRALARMATCAKVTHVVSKTEFLEYDVPAKFQEFFVTDTGNSNSANAPSDAANISYLAKVFKVDPLHHHHHAHPPDRATHTDWCQ